MPVRMDGTVILPGIAVSEEKTAVSLRVGTAVLQRRILMDVEGEMKELKIFKLDDGENWWIAAYDKQDALEVGKTMDIGIQEDEEVGVEELDPSSFLTVVCEDGFDPEDKALFPAEPMKLGRNGAWVVTATCVEWAAVSKHGDCVCSTVY
jgi:hypothetical protein